MVFVFKTSINSKSVAKQIIKHLSTLLPHAKLTFDLEDRDKILRIESKSNISELITSELPKMGLLCVELE